jgi:hypothetical protein
MAIEKLHDSQVRALAKTTSSKSDGGGLTFRGRAGGNAEIFFVYQKTGYGKYRMYIGTYPNMTLATARTQAAKWRAVLAAGGDPKDSMDNSKREAQHVSRTLLRYGRPHYTTVSK